MRVSTKGRFAVNALIDLALHAPAGPVSLASIARRQRVSPSYLEQLFSALRREGVLDSTRGPGGGYSLSRDAADISVAEIVAAVRSPLDDPAAGERGDDLSRKLWQRLDAAVLEQMAGISLASLVAEHAPQGTRPQTAPVRRSVAVVPAVKPPRKLAPNSVFAFGRSFAA